MVENDIMERMVTLSKTHLTQTYSLLHLLKCWKMYILFFLNKKLTAADQNTHDNTLIKSGKQRSEEWDAYRFSAPAAPVWLAPGWT